MNDEADNLLELIGYLTIKNKAEIAAELSDYHRVSQESANQELDNKLKKWQRLLRPVINAVDSWMNGPAREKLVNLQWQKYKNRSNSYSNAEKEDVVWNERLGVIE